MQTSPHMSRRASRTSTPTGTTIQTSAKLSGGPIAGANSTIGLCFVSAREEADIVIGPSCGFARAGTDSMCGVVLEKVVFNFIFSFFLFKAEALSRIVRFLSVCYLPMSLV
jgi:hypothetical protein